MKKLYTLSLTLFVATFTFAQTPIITGIMDGDCNGGNPKAVEIYASGTVNFAEYTLENQTNANTGTWSAALNLAPLGTVTDSFVYVILGGTPSPSAGDPTPIANVARFASEFPAIASTAVLDPPTGTPSETFPQPMNVNGDDRIRIINSTSLTVIDQFGVSDTDGTGTPWEYLDSWAKRSNGTGPDGSSFDVANWTFGGVAALNNQGLCQAAAAFSTLVPFGQFTLANEQFEIAGLQVYPNPVTNGILNITTDNNDAKSVILFDVLGKQVINTTVTDQPINVASLNRGVYFVKITEAGKTATRKLVIK
jgi:hypothetical protein